MDPQGQLAESLASTETEIVTESDATITEEYKKLNDKCDVVIAKIKNRKNNKKSKITG